MNQEGFVNAIGLKATAIRGLRVVFAMFAWVDSVLRSPAQAKATNVALWQRRGCKGSGVGLCTSILCGMLLGLSMPGFGGWQLAWIALIPALWRAGRSESVFRAFSEGFLIGFISHGFCFLWFFDLHPLTWLGFTEWGSRGVTLAGWLLLASEGGWITGLLLALYRFLPGGWPRLLLFPALWVLGFWMLHWTPMALPWALLEYTQADVRLMRLLAGGLTAAAPAALLIFHNVLWAERMSWLPGMAGRFSPRWLLPLAVPFCLTLLQAWPPAEKLVNLPLPMLVVQGELPIERIRSGHLSQAEIDAAYLRPVERLRLPAGTLLVYPEEGVVPGWIPVEAPTRNPMAARLIRMARERRIAVIVGVSATDAHDGRYNALMLIPPDGKACRFYYKRRLVPFGEFTPYDMEMPLRSFLATLNVDYGTFYQPGSESVVSLSVGKVRLGPLICFELIDATPWGNGYALRYRRDEANLLVNINNLGWFHGNPLLEAQFLSIGRMRAAEAGIPLVIAGNTGLSAILSAEGEVLMRTAHRASGKPQWLFLPSS